MKGAGEGPLDDEDWRKSLLSRNADDLNDFAFI